MDEERLTGGTEETPVPADERQENTATGDMVQEDTKKTPRKGLTMTLALLSVALVSAFPVLFLYLQNTGDVEFSEIFPPLGVFLAVGLGLFLVCAALMRFRSAAKAALVACLCTLIFQNYALLEALFTRISSRLKLWHVLPVLLVLCVAVGVLLYKKVRPADAGKMNAILALVFGALILINLVTAIPSLVSGASGGGKAQTGGEMPAGGNSAGASGETMPNVYWLIFDEMSTNDNLLKYYGYDNSAFTGELEALGFTVNYGCRNESAATATIIGNYVNLDYVLNDSMPVTERNKAWVNPPALQLARQHGYEVIGVDESARFGLDPVVGGGGAATGTVEGESFADLLLNRTVIKNFRTGVSSAKINAITDSFAFLQNAGNFPASNTFTMGYMLAPHQPFYFDADGNLNDPAGFQDWVNKEYYLGYSIYVSNQISAIARSITANDPQAVVIVQSDHSARYLADADGTTLIDPADKPHAFCAVYYGGQPLDIEGLSGVNVLRTVFGKLYGEEMPPLEVPGHE